MIKPKEKPCKGTGKASGHGCGVKTKIRTFGLGLDCKCYQKWLYGSDNGLEYVKKISLTVKKEKEKKVKEKMKSNVTNWKDKLQTEINKIVRLIDKDLPCLARKKFGQMHAGHVYARGGNSNMRYNLHNIHRQNAQSNHFQNDDGLLREGLINEYGSDYMEFITSLKSTPEINLKNKDYEELTEKARKIVLRLKKEDKTYNTVERIEMRNKINVELQIYDYNFVKYFIIDEKR